MKFKRLKESLTLYRGISEKNFSQIYNSSKSGLFFSTSEKGASRYGKVFVYKLSNDANISKGTSSYSYCEEHNLLNKKYDFIKDYLYLTKKKSLELEDEGYVPIKDIDTVEQVERIIYHDYNDPLNYLTSAIYQRVVYEELKNKYDGIHYTDEDNINREQYQIWNTSVITKLE